MYLIFNGTDLPMEGRPLMFLGPPERKYKRGVALSRYDVLTIVQGTEARAHLVVSGLKDVCDVESMRLSFQGSPCSFSVEDPTRKAGEPSRWYCSAASFS